jgi:hypothetical protein
MRRRSEEIQRQRILAGIPGFLLGLLAGGSVSYWLRGTVISRITFAGCLLGIALALAFFQKRLALPSEDDYHAATWDEANSPLGITSKAPIQRAGRESGGKSAGNGQAEN